MSVEKNVPEIRFEGFGGEWADTILSDVIDVRSGKDYKHLGKGNIPVYGTGGYMLSVDSALSNNEDAIGIGRKGTIDKPYLLRAPFWTVDTLFYSVPNPKFKLDFLYCLFQKIDWKKHDESTGVPSLSKVAINNIPVRVAPENEQTQIGNYFQKLDSLINQHQQKHDKLSNIKKAMLEKMFPKPGETVPEIRFKGFSGEWEETQLDEICSLITKQTGFDYSATIKPSLLRSKNGESYPFIQNKDFTGHDINLDTDFYIPKNVADKFPRILIDIPSVLISISGKIGNVGFYDLPVKAVVGGAVGICKLFSGVDGAVIVHQLLSNVGQEYFQTLTKSSSHANITVEDIRAMKVKLPPTLEEKKIIGAFFNQMDMLIYQHQQQITKLNNIKQACLNKMFV